MPRGIYDRNKSKPRGFWKKPVVTPPPKAVPAKEESVKLEPQPEPPAQNALAIQPCDMGGGMPFSAESVLTLLRPPPLSRVQQLAEIIGELTEEDLADVDAEIGKHERQLVGLDAVRRMFRRGFESDPPAVAVEAKAPNPSPSPGLGKKRGRPKAPPIATSVAVVDMPEAEGIGDVGPELPAGDDPEDQAAARTAAAQGDPGPRPEEGLEAKLMWLRRRTVRFLAGFGKAARPMDILKGVPLGPRWINPVLDHPWFNQTAQGVLITPEARQAVLDE